MSDSPTGHRGPVRVVLVDDHDVVRGCVRDLMTLSGGIVVVAEDDSAATAATTILDAAPDVAVVDLRLGDGSGIEVCREVTRRDAGIATLLLTADDDEQAGVATVLSGARGYALKLVRGNRLVEAVREIDEAPDFLSTAAGDRALTWLATERDRDATRFSAQQGRVLGLICRGRTDTEIAEQLGLTDQDVTTLVSALLVELGFPSTVAPTGDVTRPPRGSWE